MCLNVISESKLFTPEDLLQINKRGYNCPSLDTTVMLLSKYEYSIYDSEDVHLGTNDVVNSVGEVHVLRL